MFAILSSDYQTYNVLPRVIAVFVLFLLVLYFRVYHYTCDYKLETLWAGTNPVVLVVVVVVVVVVVCVGGWMGGGWAGRGHVTHSQPRVQHKCDCTLVSLQIYLNK